jgi:hypothetical protein
MRMSRPYRTRLCGWALLLCGARSGKAYTEWCCVLVAISENRSRGRPPDRYTCPSVIESISAITEFQREVDAVLPATYHYR